MTRWPHYLTVAVGVGCIAAVLSLTAARPAVAQKGGGGTAPITIAGPLPLPVQEVGTPFQAMLCDFGASPCAFPDSLTVPSDVRLVIDFVSGVCFASGGAVPEVHSVSLITTVATTQVNHYLIPVPNVNTTNVNVSQVTKIHADPGTDVTLVVSVSAGGGCGPLTISGHTIRVPSV